MGADSCGGSPEGQEIITVERPRKILRTGTYLIGYTGSFRIGQALCGAELPEPPPDGDLYEHMVSRFLPAVAHVLRQDRDEIGDMWMKDTGVPLAARGCLAVALGGRVFGVTADFSILDPGNCIAIGSGRAYAYGALHALGTEGRPEDRVEKALEATAAYSPSVRGPFHIETLPPQAVQEEKRRNHIHGG